MKSNLDNLYKTNSDYETSGVWYALSDEVGFRVRRFGGKNGDRVKQALAKHHKPFARQIQTGKMSAEKEKKIMNKVFVESCLVTWKGVEIDGELKDFTPELALEFFDSLPDLATDLLEFAQELDNFKNVEQEEVGNF